MLGNSTLFKPTYHVSFSRFKEDTVLSSLPYKLEKQLSNIPSGTSVISVGSLTVFKFMHPLNTFFPNTVLLLFDKSISSNPVYECVYTFCLFAPGTHNTTSISESYLL